MQRDRNIKCMRRANCSGIYVDWFMVVSPSLPHSSDNYNLTYKKLKVHDNHAEKIMFMFAYLRE